MPLVNKDSTCNKRFFCNTSVAPWRIECPHYKWLMLLVTEVNKILPQARRFSVLISRCVDYSILSTFDVTNRYYTSYRYLRLVYYLWYLIYIVTARACVSNSESQKMLAYRSKRGSFWAGKFRLKWQFHSNECAPIYANNMSSLSSDIYFKCIHVTYVFV